MGVADNSVRFTLRLPEELRDQIMKIAKENHRSLNSEIVVMLQNGRDAHIEESKKKQEG